MCGRYVSVQADADLVDEFDATDATDGQSPPPDYNIAPTDPVRIVVNRPLRAPDGTVAAAPTRQLRLARWGLVPSWSRDIAGAARKINARAETVPTAAAFRRAYAARRCLVPADGWYEWQAVDAEAGVRKQPMYMTAADGHGLAFAGLYEFWGERPNTMTSCAIITTASAGALADVHDRMPLLVPRDAWSRWLDPSVDDPAELLTPYDEARGQQLELRPVSALVNSVRNDGPELIVAEQPPPQPQRLF
jgi:putative SOS response-associated peptidase YedK